MQHIHKLETADIQQPDVLDLSVFHRIDINLYPLFIAVYEQQSISKAAQILSISQSAASHALQRLRNLLNDELFLRSGHKMLPSAYSEQIYPVIQHALTQIQAMSLAPKSFVPNMLQRIKIAVHDEVEPIIFPKIVQHFQQLNVDVQFLSIKLDRKTVIADLIAQQVDFFIDLEQNFGEKINAHTLVQDHFKVCSQHPIMDAKTYFKLQHIGVSSRRTGVLIEDIFLKREQLSRQIFLRCQHYSTALQILEQQPNAVLTIPQHVLVHLKVAKTLNIYAAPFDFPRMNLDLFWLKDTQYNPRLHFLRNEIIKIFA